jgi:uncharacterized protein YhaN
MKLLTLNLKAVGPFTGVVLDLSGGEHGLHLIYGPNEAGKTSTLRAVSHLLFRFPQRSIDDFVHPNDQLRIGGKLRHGSGDLLEIIRRRGQKNTLRGPDDTSIIGDEQLTRFLGGMNQDTFESMFGIDHERLTRAGEEIRTGQGQLGELLFAAGAGLAGMGQAQKTLQQGLDELFLPRGQKPRINKALSDLKDTQQELKQRQVSSEEWQKHDRAYHETSSAAEQIREAVRKDRGEQARLKRIKSAASLVARRRRLGREIAALGKVVRLRDDFGVEFRNADDKFRQAELTISRAREAIEEVAEILSTIEPPRMLLEAAGEIESLQERLGAVEKAASDRGKLEGFQQDAEHEARRILRELSRPIDLDAAETLRPRADEPAFIRVLAQRFAEWRGQAESARKTIARLASQIKHHASERAELENTSDVEPLLRAIRQARKAGDLDARLAETRSALARADKKAATALAQLPGWSRSAQELEQLAPPLSATIDQFEVHLGESIQKRRLLTERLAAEDDSISQAETQLQSQELQQDVPSEELLVAARSRRDHGWRLIKAAWLENISADDDVAAFVAEFGPRGTLATSYETSVQRGDELADRLRREADRVARKAESLAQLNRHRTARVALTDELRLIDERLSRLEREWHALCVPLGITAETRTPAELRAWLRQREVVVGLLERTDEARQVLEPLERAFQSHRTALIEALDDAGEAPSRAGHGLSDLLAQAETVVKRHDDLTHRRAKLENTLAAAQAERTNAELSLQTALAELTTWRSEWSAMMAKIGLEADATPEQAEVFLTKISELLEKLTDRRKNQSRIRGIDRDADDFARDVSALATRVAPESGVRPAADQTRELARRLRAAQADAQRCAALTQERDRDLGILHTAETEREEALVCLDRLCKEANCTEVNELPEAERRWRRLAQLELDMAGTEEQLLTAAAGTDLTSFADEVEQTDPGVLDATIDDFEVKITTQENELRGLDQTIGAERAHLARMDGSDRAAETADIAQTLLARLQGDVVRYATLKLAATVMQRGIERYREKNQGPILARAGALFAGMTGGSFTRLQIDDDGNGRSVLKGARPDGRLVGVDGMSDGSHDQLYLALRLASLESWLESHEPVPFVVDDILLNFDDVRATAALGALAELSRRTQVLFFTHHRHIVELARAHLVGDVVFVHELPGPRSQSWSVAPT